eukprot:287014-Amphidinium_carterae.1
MIRPSATCSQNLIDTVATRLHFECSFQSTRQGHHRDRLARTTHNDMRGTQVLSCADKCACLVVLSIRIPSRTRCVIFFPQHNGGKGRDVMYMNVPPGSSMTSRCPSPSAANHRKSVLIKSASLTMSCLKQSRGNSARVTDVAATCHGLLAESATDLKSSFWAPSKTWKEIVKPGQTTLGRLSLLERC